MSDNTNPTAGNKNQTPENTRKSDDFHDHLDAFGEQEEMLFPEDQLSTSDDTDHLMDHLQHQEEVQPDLNNYPEASDFDSELSHLDPFMDDEMQSFESDSSVQTYSEQAPYSKLITSPLTATDCFDRERNRL